MATKMVSIMSPQDDSSRNSIALFQCQLQPARDEVARSFNCARNCKTGTKRSAAAYGARNRDPRRICIRSHTKAT